MTPMAWMRAFHRAAKVSRLPYADRNVALLRANLIAEETDEVIEELENAHKGVPDYSALAKELADVLVVVYGTAEVYGIPLDAVFEAVMKSNMTKTIEPEWREDGKLLKGKHYVPPNISEVIKTAAGR